MTLGCGVLVYDFADRTWKSLIASSIHDDMGDSDFTGFGLAARFVIDGEREARQVRSCSIRYRARGPQYAVCRDRNRPKAQAWEKRPEQKADQPGASSRCRENVMARSRTHRIAFGAMELGVGYHTKKLAPIDRD
jgi:hypothetical protein